MPSRINIGPENGPYVGINEENGNLQLEDNGGNVVAEWDETNAQWDFVENDISGVGAFDSESVNTVETKIEKHGRYADRVVDKIDADTYIIIGRDNQVLYEGEDLSGIVNDSLEDDFQDSNPHYHFASVRPHGIGDYIHEDTVEWGITSSVQITGGGRNKSMIREGSSFSEGDALWNFDKNPEDSANIMEIEGVKLAKDTDTDNVTAIRVSDYDEFNFKTVECRGFAHNLHVDPSGDPGDQRQRWNNLVDFWSVDPTGVGVQIDSVDSNNRLYELLVNASFFDAYRGDGTTPALKADGAAGLNFGNCRFDYGPIMQLDNVSFSVFSDCVSDTQGETLEVADDEAAIQLGLDGRCDHLSLTGNVFRGANLDHWIEMGPSGSGTVADNRMRGHDADAILDPGDNLDTDNNNI